MGWDGRRPNDHILPRPDKPDGHPPDAGEAVPRGPGRNLGPLDGLVQSRQGLGTNERAPGWTRSSGGDLPGLDDGVAQVGRLGLLDDARGAEADVSPGVVEQAGA